LQQKGWRLSGEKIDHGLTHVKEITGLHGRWELIRKKPFVVLDVGHNEDGIRQVLNQIHSMKNDIEQVHFITGMVKDKEVDRVLELLPETFNYYFTNAHIPRALPAVELKEKAAICGLSGNHYDDVNLH
jgi:dihydrofolate synthase/folylpolyglutamate synthase